MPDFPKNHHAEKRGSHRLTPVVEIPPGRQGVGTVWPGAKQIPYETLRGLPFGHPPFLAFLAMAASLAGLFDLPPSLPI